MRAADQGSSDRGADLEAKTVPEERAAQHHDGLLQHARDSCRICRSAQDDREFVATNGRVFADDKCVYVARDMRVGLVASAA